MFKTPRAVGKSSSIDTEAPGCDMSALSGKLVLVIRAWRQAEPGGAGKEEGLIVR
jgi:hypothetical protein